MLDSAVAVTSDTCILQHRMFSVLQGLVFRRSEGDMAPVMIVQLGDREAAIPFPSLKVEFGIEDDSADGQMLGRMAEALHYVTLLRLGDKLPREVLDGGASWEPEARHRAIAHARLRRELIAWREGDSSSAQRIALEATQRLEGDSGLRDRVMTAMQEAARTLSLGSADEVVQLLEQLAEELAFIEALRDWLLGPVQELVARLIKIADSGQRGDVDRAATLTQVRRLAAVGLRQISTRFDEVDAATAEVVAALRNAERHREFIRTNRDWLYRTMLGWNPILREWSNTDDADLEDSLWSMINRVYQFLAPRYMPVQEWVAQGGLGKRGPEKLKAYKQW